MFPSCYSNDCNMWGTAKATDGKEKGTNSLAMVESSDNPWMQASA